MTRSSSTDHSSDDEDKLDEIVAGYLDRMNAGEMLDRDEIFREHPKHAQEVVERLEVFQAVGVGPEISAAPLGTLGDYTLRRQIGRGGMGVVYEAWQNSMDRQVALKVMPKAIAVDTRAVARFIQEAQLAGKLNHPNIVHVHGMGVEQQIPYYAMDFVEGETLAQVLAKLKDAPEEAETPFGPRIGQQFYFNVAEAFAAVTDGLQHAHSRKVIHRDIKPSNLILDRERRLRILDFGLARFEGQESLTVSGDVVGTPQYMSPEQARRKKIPIDHRTDVYSLGATLYEMLTLEPPFRGKDHADTLSQIIEREPPELRKRNARVPKDLETIVLKCLRKDAGDRYGTAEALAQDVRRFVRGDAIEARPQPAWERFARRAWRHKGRVMALAGALLLCLAAGLLVQGLYRDARRRGEERYRREVLSAIVKLQMGQMLINAESLVDPNVDPYRHFTRADSRVTQGGGGFNPVVAGVQDLERTIAAFPAWPDAYYQCARGLIFLGREGEAIQALDQALAADATYAPARTLRALLVEGKHATDGPSRDTDRPREARADVSWIEAWRTAYLASSSRKWKEAGDAYGALIELNVAGPEAYLGSSLEARMGRGYSLLEVKEYVRAIEDFAAASALWPGFLEPRLLKGKAYYLLGDRAQAESIFEETYRTAPFQDDVARVLVILYSSSFLDFEKALAWAWRMEGGTFRETTKASCLNMLGRFDDALAAADRAIEMGGATTEAFLNRGTACFGKKRHKDTVAMYQKATQLDPRDPVAHCKLGYALTKWGRNVESLAECRRAIELNPDYVGAYIGLNWCLPSLGRVDEAMEAARKAYSLAPKSGSALKEFAFALAREGRFEQADRLYKEAVQLDPRYGYIYGDWGLALELEGKQDEALTMYRKALELGPVPSGRAVPGTSPVHHHGISRILEERGQHEDAFRECCRAILAGPWSPSAQEDLPALLRAVPQVSVLGRPLDELVGGLEPLVDQDYPCLFRTLALAHVWAEKRRDLQKALEYARLASDTEPDSPDIASILAGIQFASGEMSRAVVTLEAALRFPGARCYLAQQLEDYRDQLRPDLVSYASIDDALGSCPDEAAGHELLVRFVAVASGEDAGARLGYLEARLLQRAGKHAEEERKLAGLMGRDAGEPEPILRLAECFRVSGDPARAEAILREALGRETGDDARLWDLWIAICLVDLALAPRDNLTSFPQLHPRGHAGDLRWLIERLAADEPIRIDCGSAVDRVGTRDIFWSRDRFFSGGRAEVWPMAEFAKTDDAALYRTERGFLRDQYLPSGYRIPLPRGRYQVTLHFAEACFRVPGRRSFAIAIESNEVLRDYEPLAAGKSTADVRHFAVDVSDGVLDIDFVRKKDDPMICGIEVEAVR